MTDYSNACVYKLVCKDESITDIYIGCTINFKRRGKEHKSRCNNIKRPGYNFKVYKFIRDNGGWENWQMIKICDIKPCLDRNIMKKAERELIDELKPSLNTTTPNRNRNDWIKDNIDWVREYNRLQMRKWRAKKKATQPTSQV